MKILTSPTTPFGRKTRIAAMAKGLGNIEFVNVDTNPPHNADLIANNPLGKIPVLVLDTGETIYDSRVICEYLDTLGAADAPRLFPSDSKERMRTLTLGALADGIAEAGVLVFYESRFRSEEMRNADWVARQQSKVDAGLDYLDANPPGWNGTPGYAPIALACALGHLDLRHGGRWRNGRARLVDWLERFSAAMPSYEATRPPA
ncbi:MAG: glutathione S-transferase N-terminal domain-containing protein [Hyphomicrobiaceae bacterium]